MTESEMTSIRRKNHEALASSKRLWICIAISLAVLAVIILGSSVSF